MANDEVAVLVREADRLTKHIGLLQDDLAASRAELEAVNARRIELSAQDGNFGAEETQSDGLTVEQRMDRIEALLVELAAQVRGRPARAGGPPPPPIGRDEGEFLGDQRRLETLRMATLGEGVTREVTDANGRVVGRSGYGSVSVRPGGG